MASKKETLTMYGLVCIVVGIAVAGLGGSAYGAAGCAIAGVFMLWKAVKTVG
jgi:hypothetical protein